jgi:two-component system, cell cycle sensor histidine kinase and response regulator CckA
MLPPFESARPADTETTRDMRAFESQLCELRQLAAVGELSKGVAHNLNNLLMAILGYTDLLSAGAPRQEGDRLALREIEKAATRAAVLTRQILDFGAAGPADPPLVAPADVLRSTQALMGGRLRRNVVLTFDTPDLPVVTRVERREIEQAVVQMVFNALDALPDSGSIHVGLSLTEVLPAGLALVPTASGPWVRVSVEDTAAPVARDIGKVMFEPLFTTLLPARSALGLSILHGVARRTGAGILVDAVRGRTRFSLFFPALVVRDPLNVPRPGLTDA